MSWQPPFGRFSLLSGDNRANRLGQGLDFAELRRYQMGDDVRRIDWKVTQRTGQAYVRTYTEEREKVCRLIVDQTNRMYFASDGSLKSVIAAELSTVVAGRMIEEGCHVHLNLITDPQIYTHALGRGRRVLPELIALLADISASLPLPRGRHSGVTDQLKDLVDRQVRYQQLFIFSDFYGFDMKLGIGYLRELARFNNIYGFHISDPLEAKLPEHSMVVGDEARQLSISATDTSLHRRFTEQASQRASSLEGAFSEIRQPLLCFTTHRDTWQQVEHMHAISAVYSGGH
ncbi:DUF58 domain-containing protein [Aliagarivorans marinus]|uniref:DUF58 domain-containing protein n=1 Tax=Aliagarivorans marinus TaxID=561965 RepID=UPI00047AC649|nr:DUF58 domain-containing protein [Aliagarivorans marinus]